MFYYIEQPCFPTIPIALVKTESDYTVWSVETSLERWMLVVAVIIVDAYFFDFLRPDQSPWGHRNRCFLVALCHLILWRMNFEVCTYSYFQWYGYFHYVHWGIRPPPSKKPLRFLPSPRTLKSANCPNHPFRQSPHLYWFFITPTP